MSNVFNFQPHNIVIASSHESAPIKITEFGIATEIPECGYVIGRIGTPHFMAPEVVERENYGCKVDVWSCGEIFLKLFFPLSIIGLLDLCCPSKLI